jgi:CHAT domain-containing protein
VYVGADATEARLKLDAPRATIVHIAAHGVLDDASPMYSHVALGSSRGDGEDGILEAWELANLHLPASIVVLAACETARGHAGGGEGMIGMTWALLVGGAAAAVVSQWRVESSSTAELMLAFHRHVKPALDRRRGAAAAAALRAAQLELLRDERYRHPFYWAGFVVVADAF